MMLSRFLKAANATVFGQIIARFGSFILVPIFLARWTPAVYGEWLTLYATVGYLSSLDVGMQAAALNRLTAAFARHDIDDYRRAQNSALAMYIVTAGLGFVILVVVALTMPVGRWIGLRITPRWDASVVLIFLGAYVLWSMPAKIIIGSYQTMGNLARSQWISNSQIAANMVLMAVLLLMHRSMKTLAILPLLMSLLAVILVIGDLRRNYPEMAPGIGAANWLTMRSLVKPSLLFAVITAGMLLHYQAATLLVSITLGGAAVTIFSVSRTLVIVLRAATDTIADSIAPDVCRLDAVQDKERLGQLFKFLLGLSICIGIAGAATLWWEGGSVISVWTHGRLVPDLMLIRFFAIVAIGQSVWVGLSVFGTATNRNRNVAIAILGSNVVALGLGIALVHKLGVVAVPIGLLVGEAIFCYHFLVLDTCGKCGVRYANFAPKLWSFVVITSLLDICAAYPIHSMFHNRFAVLRWLAVGIITTAISTASTWFVWFGQNHREMLAGRLAALFKTKALEHSTHKNALTEAVADE